MKNVSHAVNLFVLGHKYQSYITGMLTCGVMNSTVNARTIVYMYAGATEATTKFTLT